MDLTVFENELADVNQQIKDIDEAINNLKAREFVKKKKLQMQKLGLVARRRKLTQTIKKLTKKDMKLDARQERLDTRSETKQIAYQNGIDPTASALNGIGGIVGNLGDGVSKFFAGKAGLTRSERMNKDNMQDPNMLIWLVGAVVALFMLLKKK